MSIHAHARARDAAGSSRGHVSPAVGGTQPGQVTGGFLRKGGQVVTEGGWLSELQVGDIRPDRVGPILSAVTQRPCQPRDSKRQRFQSLPQCKPERDSPRFASGASEVDDAGHSAYPALEFALPAVVGIPEGHVVGEVFRGDIPHV